MWLNGNCSGIVRIAFICKLLLHAPRMKRVRLLPLYDVVADQIRSDQCEVIFIAHKMLFEIFDLATAKYQRSIMSRKNDMHLSSLHHTFWTERNSRIGSRYLSFFPSVPSTWHIKCTHFSMRIAGWESVKMIESLAKQSNAFLISHKTQPYGGEEGRKVDCKTVLINVEITSCKLLRTVWLPNGSCIWIRFDMNDGRAFFRWSIHQRGYYVAHLWKFVGLEI